MSIKRVKNRWNRAELLNHVKANRLFAKAALAQHKPKRDKDGHDWEAAYYDGRIAALEEVVSYFEERFSESD